MFFKNLNFKPLFPKVIEKLSVATFGVYLIHEIFLVRYVLWDKVLDVEYFARKAFYVKVGAMIGSVIDIFFICAIIDMIRKFIIDKYGI